MSDIKPELLNRVNRLCSELDSLASYIAGFERISDGDDPKPRAKPILGLYYESVGDGGFRPSNTRVGGNRPPLEAMQILRKILPWCIFRMPYPRFLLKDSQELDWNLLDHDLSVFSTLGFNIGLARHGVPAWATVEGKPSHEIYERGCLLQDTWEYAAGHADPTRNREWCENVAHVRPDALYDLGRKLAMRLPPETVQLWIAGPNEPEEPLYNGWTYMANKGLITHEEAVHFTVSEQTEPFTTGVRSVYPDAHFLGPEAGSGPSLARYLKYEKERNLRLYDTISIHPYSWDKANGYPISNAIARIRDEFGPVIAEYANGREVWHTEFGERSKKGLHAEVAEQALAIEPSRAFFFHDWEELFDKKGRERSPKQWIPNRSFFELEALAGELAA